MIAKITNSTEGHRITAYRDIVVGEAIMGSNAVVGIDLDHDGAGNSMRMVSAPGTAVQIN